MASLKIIRPGPLSLIQDKGRTNHQHLGLAQGGAADGYAFFWVNYLLDNNPNAATIEITLGPFGVQFNDDTVIAIAGAEMNCTLNDKVISNWQTHRIQTGDILTFNRASEGLRTYLGVRGGLQTTELFASRSMVLREKFPGFHGAALQKEIDLQFPQLTTLTTSTTWINRSVPWRYLPDYQNELTLQIIPSYQFSDFDQAARDLIESSRYTISSQSDRMGYRLSGSAIEWQRGDIVSEGIAYGSVQIPPNGQPIVLLNDRQTIGGYPKIGCVTRQDCYQLAQRRPGQTVRFKFASA